MLDAVESPTSAPFALFQNFPCPFPVHPLFPSRMDVREAFVALNLIEHVGPVRVRQLLEHFGEAPAILSASRSQLAHVRGIGPETAEAIASWETTIDLKGELQRIQDFGCHILVQSD